MSIGSRKYTERGFKVLGNRVLFVFDIKGSRSLFQGR